MKLTDVFTPGNFPVHTFVDDHLTEKQQQLKDALDSGSTLISISGPSKSGKTVFIERSIGRDNLVQITGAGVTKVEDLWLRVFDLIGTPIHSATSTTTGSVKRVSGTGSVEGGIVFAKGAVGVSVESSSSLGNMETASLLSDYLQLLIRELKNTGMIIFVDDFHYIPRDIQQSVAMQIKEAIRQGVKFICASVPYHADDVIRSNPDLRGRVFSIDFQYWGNDILTKIATKGFPLLNINCSDLAVEKLASEAAGSPQLMQYLCLNACYELGVREKSDQTVEFSGSAVIMNDICRRTVQSTDYGSVVEKMKEGPKTRGSDRKLYTTTCGWQGDVYRLLVKALSIDPPQLIFRYQPLNERITGICFGNNYPSGSSITSACAQSAKIVNDSVGDRIVDWDSENDVFEIRDPYFLFYIRWSEVADRG